MSAFLERLKIGDTLLADGATGRTCFLKACES